MKTFSRLALIAIIASGAPLKAMNALGAKQKAVQAQKIKENEAALAESMAKKNIEFYAATQNVKSLLNAINAEPNISNQAAETVRKHLKDIDALAQKLWGASFNDKPLYKNWIEETTPVKDKAEKVLENVRKAKEFQAEFTQKTNNDLIKSAQRALQKQGYIAKTLAEPLDPIIKQIEGIDHTSFKQVYKNWAAEVQPLKDAITIALEVPQIADFYLEHEKLSSLIKRANKEFGKDGSINEQTANQLDQNIKKIEELAKKIELAKDRNLPSFNQVYEKWAPVYAKLTADVQPLKGKIEIALNIRDFAKFSLLNDALSPLIKQAKQELNSKGVISKQTAEQLNPKIKEIKALAEKIKREKSELASVKPFYEKWAALYEKWLDNVKPLKDAIATALTLPETALDMPELE